MSDNGEGTKQEGMLVRRIVNGTVIDHITAGMGIRVMQVLNLLDSENETIAYLMNAYSAKSANNRKDVLKISDRYLTPEEIDVISIFSPEATINIIRNGRVVEKRQVQVPQQFTGVLACPNKNCITNEEQVHPEFKTIQEKPIVRLRCLYCERTFDPVLALDQARNGR